MLKKILFIAALVMSAAALAADEEGIEVKAKKQGDAIVIDLSMTVAATPQEVWTVLVDYDHMTEFLSNLQSSKIVEKNGNVWKVAQKGQSSHGPVSFSFENLREVDVQPYDTIRSHLISGTMKKLEGFTQLTAAGNVTRVAYHSESVSGVWVPPMVGTSIVEDEVRKQFQDMRAEIVRRKTAKSAD